MKYIEFSCIEVICAVDGSERNFYENLSRDGYQTCIVKKVKIMADTSKILLFWSAEAASWVKWPRPPAADRRHKGPACVSFATSQVSRRSLHPRLLIRSEPKARLNINIMLKSPFLQLSVPGAPPSAFVVWGGGLYFQPPRRTRILHGVWSSRFQLSPQCVWFRLKY